MGPMSTTRESIAVELTALSARVVARLSALKFESLDPLECEVVRKRSIICAPAEPAAIVEAEGRIGSDLPQEFAYFLAVSNGMVLPGFEGHAIRLLPAEEIANFRDLDPEALESWRQDAMGEPIAPVHVMPNDIMVFRDDVPDFPLLATAIAVSEIVNSGGVFIVRFHDYGHGAYEVWELGPWSGCIRYRTFLTFLREHMEHYLTG